MNTVSQYNVYDKQCFGHRISIIDNSALAKQLAESFTERGCDIHHIDSIDALQTLAQSDYLILDPLGFPDYDFGPFLEKNESVPVIIWSDIVEMSQRDRYFQHGVIDILSKNEPLGEICSNLRELFSNISDNHAFHITLISDDPKYKDHFSAFVRHRGYRNCYIDNIETLKNKWEEYEHELSDLIVLDMMKENLSEKCFSLIRYLRSERFSEIPIIAIIKDEEPNFIRKLYRYGINDIVHFPYHADMLINALTRHLDFKISKKRFHYDKHLSAQLKAMIDSSSIVSKTNPKGIITYVNDQFCGISGYSREELIGKPHNIIRHPDNSPLLFKQMWHIIQNKKIFHGIMMNRHKNGSPYYVDTTIAPVLNDVDEIVEYISIRHDITPLIEKQHEIEAKRKKIQNVLDAQTSLVCMIDKIKGIENANKSFLNFLGTRTLKEFKESFNDLHELFLDIDGSIQIRETERYVWLDQLYEKKKRFNKIAMKDYKNNHHIFAIHVEKIPDPSFSEGICYLVSFEDVTELNRALKEAQEASEVESRFLATMSHEIRTPLNGILGFTELIHETSLSEEQKRYFDAVQYSGETLRQIINNILDVMKFSRENPTFESIPMNLIPELETLFFPFYVQAKEKGVDLLIYIDPTLPIAIQTDPLRLKQILNNLIANAIKFTPAGKKVYVRIKKLYENNGKIKVSFSVADEGIGIKENHKSRIFNPFTQADNTIAREFGGTGLGLNIVLRLVDGMEGHLNLKSIDAQGSVFNVKLTFRADAEHYPYRSAHQTTYLYLPSSELTPRFALLERYLEKLYCHGNGIIKTNSLQNIEDRENQAICLMSEAIGFIEISTIIRKFVKTDIYIFLSNEGHPAQSMVKQPNLHWIDPPLSWSTLTRSLRLYDEIIPKTDTKQSISFKDLSILVAEDNEVNRFYIEEVLKKLSIHYDIAPDGYTAVKKFINGHYDLVLMDINMPNIDGITATKQILRFEQEVGASHTPIIGLSADAVEKNIASYIQNGLDGYLIKPMKKSDLLTLLKEYFGHRITVLEEQPSENEAPDSSDDISLATSAQKLELPPEIVRKLYEKYIDNAHNLIEQMMHIQSPEALKASIHSLKGISKNLYIEPLGTECAILESDLPNLDEQGKCSRIQALYDHTQRVIGILNQELAK